MFCCERFVCFCNFFFGRVIFGWIDWKSEFCNDDFFNVFFWKSVKEVLDIKMFKFLSEKLSDEIFVIVSVLSLID